MTGSVRVRLARRDRRDRFGGLRSPVSAPRPGANPWGIRPMNLEDQADGLKFLICDRDTKFTAEFDAVFSAIGVRIIRHLSRRRTRTL
jgi:hypothetical protein